MSIFDAYNAEFQSILEEIKKHINDMKLFIKTINLNEMNNKNDLKSSNTIKIIEALFSQSNELIKQMELEVRSHDIITKKKLNEKLLSYKSSIGNFNQHYHYDDCQHHHHHNHLIIIIISSIIIIITSELLILPSLSLLSLLSPTSL